jgi:hypothetical protein
VRLGFGCEFWHVHALTSDCLEEIDAQRVLGYALFKDGKNARLPYPLEKFSSDVAGRSFHNGRFIRNMVSVMKRAKSMIAVPAECCDKTNYSRIINEAEK